MIRWLVLPCLILTLAPLCRGQRYKLTFVHGSREGEQLELIEQQIDTIRKLEQIDRFLGYFPKHDAASYLLEWAQLYYMRAKIPEKAMEYGSRLLERNPDDFDAAYRMHQAAEQRKDAVLVKQWQERLLQLSEKLVEQERPKGWDEASWKQSLEMAKAMLARREYDQYMQGLEATGRTKVQLLEDFMKRYPASKYTAQIWPQLLHTYRALGEPVKALAAGERVLATAPEDVETLLVTAQLNLDRRTNYAKVVDHASRVLMIMAGKLKPPEYTDADWEKRKEYYLGLANLMIGNAYVNQSKFVQADQYLRVSLPYMKGQGQTEAAVLFYLGWSNYHLENYKEAASFFQQCTTIAGPYAEQAAKNINVLKTERRITEQ